MTNRSPMPAAERPSRLILGRTEWLVPSLIVCGVVATFAHTLWFRFVFDDPMLIVGNPFIQSAANIPRFFTEHFWSGVPAVQKSYYRPLSLLYLLTNWKLFGDDPAGWHVVSLLLHIANTALVYLLALRFLRPSPARAFAAGVGVLLFALHPIQAEVVSWICCFNDLLACLFVLISFHAYCNARPSVVAAQTPSCGHRTLWYGVSLVSYAAAILCKEPALLFPAIPFLCEVSSLHRPASAPPTDGSDSNANSGTTSGAASGWGARNRILQLLPYLAIAGVYLLLRRHALGTVTTAEVRNIYWSTEWLTLPFVLRTYLSHLIWPSGLSPFYDIPYQHNVSLTGLILPVLVVMLAAGLLMRAAWRSAAVRLFVAWILIFLAPTLHLGILPRGELVHDRYLYMPMAGLSVLAALGIAASEPRWAGAPGARRTLGVATAGFGALFALATFRQSHFWENNLVLYTRGVTIAPHNGMAANNLGAELLGRGQWDEAMAQFQIAIDNAPNLFLAHYDMGLGYYEVGRYSESEASFRRALSLVPADPESNLFLGMTYYHTNRLPQAIEQVRKAVALKPNGVGYHFVLGVMLKESGDLAGARKEFEAELKRDPNHLPTLDQLRLLGQAAASAPAARQ